jgi:hypothetical protein
MKISIEEESGNMTIVLGIGYCIWERENKEGEEIGKKEGGAWK